MSPEPGSQPELTPEPEAGPPLGPPAREPSAPDPLIARLADEIAGVPAPFLPELARSPSPPPSLPPASATSLKRAGPGAASVRRLIAEIAAEIVGPENVRGGIALPVRPAARPIPPPPPPAGVMPFIAPLPEPVSPPAPIVPPVAADAASAPPPEVVPGTPPAEAAPVLLPPVADPLIPSIPTSDLEALADAVVRHIGSRPPEQFLSVLDDRLRQIGYAPLASTSPPPAPATPTSEAPAPAAEVALPVPFESGVDRQEVLTAFEHAIAETPPTEAPPQRPPPEVAIAPPANLPEMERAPDTIPEPAVLAPESALPEFPTTDSGDVGIDRHSILDALSALTGPTEPVTEAPSFAAEADLPLPPADLDAIVRAIEAGEASLSEAGIAPPPAMPQLPADAPAEAPPEPAAPSLEAAAIETAPPEEPAQPKRRREREIVVDASTAAIQVPPHAVEEVVEHLVSQSGDVLRAIEPPREEPAAGEVPAEGAPDRVGVPPTAVAADSAVPPPAYDAEAAVDAARRHTRRRVRFFGGRVSAWMEKALVKVLHPVWIVGEMLWNAPQAIVSRARADLAASGGFRMQVGANFEELMHVGTGLVGCAWFMSWLVGGGIVPLLMAATFTVPPVFLIARNRAARTA